MAAHSLTDPLDWDIDRVVKELCTEDCTWRAPSGKIVLPPPVVLEARLRENLVDGECLLIDSDEAGFFQDLGIKAIKHKSTLRTAITQLRRRSLKYRLRTEVKDEDETIHAEVNGRDGRHESLSLDSRKRLKLMLERQRPEPIPAVTTQIQREPTPPQSLAPQVTEALAPNLPGPEETSRKKRRIVPQLISTDVDTSFTRNIPTEADVIAGYLKDGARSGRDVTIGLTEAYLGEGAMTWADLTEFDVQPHSQRSESPETSFQLPQDATIPTGRRRQINSLYKRHYMGRRNPWQARPAKADTVPGAGDPGQTEIIMAAVGGSDDEESYDSETWAEIEEERKEREALRETPSLLSKEQINMAIDEAIAELVVSWKDRKLSKRARDAHHIWTAAHKQGLRRVIEGLQHEITTYDARLAKYRTNFLDQDWSKLAEVKRVLGILEGTIEDREDALWRLELLKSPVEPARVAVRPRAARTVPRARLQRELQDDEEEILTSDSEDGLGDFVVSDDPLPDSTNDHTLPVGQHDEPKFNIGGSLVDTELEPFPNTEDVVLSDYQAINTATLGVSDTVERRDSNADTVAPDAIIDSDPDEFLDLSQVADQNLQAQRHAGQQSFSTPHWTQATSHFAEHKQMTPAPAHLVSGRRIRNSDKICVNIEDCLPRESLEKLNPNERETLRKLCSLDEEDMAIILKVVTEDKWPLEDRWRVYVLDVLNAVEIPKHPRNGDERDLFVGLLIVCLLDIFIGGKASDFGKMSDERKRMIRDKKAEFVKLVGFLRPVAANYKQDKARWAKRQGESFATPTPQQIAMGLRSGQATEEARPPNAGSPPCSDLSEEHEDAKAAEDGELESTSPVKKQKAIVRDRAAQNLRENTRRRVEEQERRRGLLRAKLAATGSTSASQKSHLIINESKEEDQGLIYVHDNIASRIKEHQVDGIRFMWNQVVMDSEARQGCLLAHTMGLGKTMQIITLLVAIADAAASEDESVSSQIPDVLKKSQTLILAPSSVVNNWMDEFLTWAPEDHRLGLLYHITSEDKDQTRIDIIQDWAAMGGVLIVGHELFTRLSKMPELGEALSELPNIVVADEAHKMKNPDTLLHKATTKIRTHARIALTGSPLANNVDEYHSLINWVAPNFLSNIQEFRAEYSIPIVEGLSARSTASQRRKALTRLRALKETVAPKVNRKTITALKEDLPPKYEFILSVPLTDLQRQVYLKLMSHIRELKTSGTNTTNTNTFSTVDLLRLVCNHPYCLRHKLEEDKKKARTQGQELAAGMTSATAKDHLPIQSVSEMLAFLSTMDMSREALSWKIQVLLKVLDESRLVGDRVLIFSQSIPTLDYLELLFNRQKRSQKRIDGSTQTSRRQSMVKDLNQNGDADIFLISTTAGGIGLNITGANRVIIMDSGGNPQNELQAVGRAYRIGQKKAVYVYRFMCGGTFEEKLHSRVVFKLQLASRVVDKKTPIPKAEQLEALLNIPTEPMQEDLSGFRGKDVVVDRILDAEELKGAVRSIVMMDTFEEEALEDKELTKEEEEHVKQLIRDNRARRSGQAPVRTPGSLDYPVFAQPPFLAGDAPETMAPQPVPGSQMQSHMQHNARPEHASMTLAATQAASEPSLVSVAHAPPLHQCTAPADAETREQAAPLSLGLATPIAVNDREFPPNAETRQYSPGPAVPAVNAVPNPRQEADDVQQPPRVDAEKQLRKRRHSAISQTHAGRRDTKRSRITEISDKDRQSQQETLKSLFEPRFGPKLRQRTDVTAKTLGDALHRRKTLQFEDVYKNGNAEQKHFIIREGNEWLILRCKEHGASFGLNPVLGARRHLAAPDHGNQCRGRDFAIKELGIRVENCDEAKATLNNAAFRERKAVRSPKGQAADATTTDEAAQVPEPANSVSKSRRRSRQRIEDDAVQAPAQKKSESALGPVDPVVGQLYLIYWEPSKSWYAGLVLPTESLAEVGMSGALSDTGLTSYIPVCYRKQRRKILGWADGYEAGGSQVTKRKFPLMYFDEDLDIPPEGEFAVPQRPLFAWVHAETLKPLQLDGLNSHHIQGLAAAKAFNARLQAIREGQAVQKEVEAAIREVTTVSEEVRGVVQATRCPIQGKQPQLVHEDTEAVIPRTQGADQQEEYTNKEFRDAVEAAGVLQGLRAFITTRTSETSSTSPPILEPTSIGRSTRSTTPEWSARTPSPWKSTLSYIPDPNGNSAKSFQSLPGISTLPRIVTSISGVAPDSVYGVLQALD